MSTAIPEREAGTRHGRYADVYNFKSRALPSAGGPSSYNPLPCQSMRDATKLWPTRKYSARRGSLTLPFRCHEGDNIISLSAHPPTAVLLPCLTFPPAATPTSTPSPRFSANSPSSDPFNATINKTNAHRSFEIHERPQGPPTGSPAISVPSTTELPLLTLPNLVGQTSAAR